MGGMKQIDGTAPQVRAPVARGPDAGPRYLQVAHALRRAIADGRYPVGSRLPTELELCGMFGISRFTARESIRVLVASGLVTRRQRTGTQVIALPDKARYTHDAASVPDLHQYARDTELRLLYVARIALDRDLARQLGAAAGTEWIHAVGIRVSADESRPMGITRLYLNPLLAGIEAKLRRREGAVYALIEAEYGLEIERVDQTLEAALLSADDAANLAAPPGAPALRIVRRYFDGLGRLLELAENLHPADRFSYRMQLRK
jgi:GntR family transcriptional regulator